jgi:cytochrome c-type biogenesis protein CcmH/NrfG
MPVPPVPDAIVVQEDIPVTPEPAVERAAPVETPLVESGADLTEQIAPPMPQVPASDVPSAHDLAQVQEYRDRLTAVPDDHETRIALARTFLREGALDDSVREYKQLLKEPALTDTLIEELERASQDHPEYSDLHLVLGDAYTRAGQLSNAMQAYKRALTRLSS